MNTNAFEHIPLACPIDGQALATGSTKSGFRCASGHSYDMARQGYLNLLPVQFKPSRAPGDSREMVVARSNVLNAGAFEPLAAELAVSLKKYEPGRALIVDAGCGDGYYSDYLYCHQQIDRAAGGGYVFLGVDISRPAILAASKRAGAIGWVVANNTHLPVQAGCADCVLSVFGYEAWNSWASLQNPEQMVITVDAGPDHLLELREILYDRVQRHSEPGGPGIDSGYRLMERRPLRWKFEVNETTMLLDLVTMTPHIHRAKPAAIRTLRTTRVETVTLDAVIRIYQRV